MGSLVIHPSCYKWEKCLTPVWKSHCSYELTWWIWGHVMHPGYWRGKQTALVCEEIFVYQNWCEWEQQDLPSLFDDIHALDEIQGIKLIQIMHSLNISNFWSDSEWLDLVNNVMHLFYLAILTSCGTFQRLLLLLMSKWSSSDNIPTSCVGEKKKKTVSKCEEIGIGKLHKMLDCRREWCIPSTLSHTSFVDSTVWTYLPLWMLIDNC